MDYRRNTLEKRGN